MQPLIHLNWFAISVAVVANIIIGFLWYGPLFGNAWMKEMAMPADLKPEVSLLKRSLLLMLGGALITSVAMAYVIALCRTSSVMAAAQPVDHATCRGTFAMVSLGCPKNLVESI
jgi:hypothetical protein